ncbi:MAG TPA: ABC transporter ATP-binding protein [Candidatus Dormibacteraeota bacterium]
MPAALELKGIVKTFGELRANDQVDLVSEWGQVHALLGENGAGKSTLMNVAYGMLSKDAGEIWVDGSQVTINGPQDAIQLGIGMVHQHFMLIPRLTVAENVELGHEIAQAGGWLDFDSAFKAVRELSQKHGLEVDPRARVEDLTVGLQQRVEIVKALYRGAKILILDEPTAALTPQETEGLFRVVRSLCAEGRAVIFITHKLGEVMEIADEITVMRRGKVVATERPQNTTPQQLAQLMVGRQVMLRVDKGPAHPGPAVLQVRDLVVHDQRRRPAVDGVTFEVRAGEIVGVAGVEGNGQNELIGALHGLQAARSGSVVLEGKDVTRLATRRLLRAGNRMIPPDRHRQGVILEFPISDNLVLDDYDEAPFAQGVLRRFPAIRSYSQRLIKAFDIRTQSAEQPVGSLSGGNQQKVVVARELATSPKVLIAAQPTRGLDVGSIEFIHSQLVKHRDEGLAVLLVSSELDEVLSLADRVLVMYRGKIVGELEGDGIDRDRIGLLMAGAA